MGATTAAAVLGAALVIPMAGGAPVAQAAPAGVSAERSERAAVRLRARGEAIFMGRQPVSGRIRGHESDLPAEVLACRQCHTGAAPDGGATAAPQLDRALLLQPLQRRGGPPSVYDVASFCKVLRTGIDPAFVLIDRIMPTYRLADAECAALWQYVTR